MIFWNPIHLMDGEARWFLTFVAILAIGALITHGWRWLCGRMCQQCARSQQFFKEAVLRAAEMPVIVSIWFFILLKGCDLISDHFFSETLFAHYTIPFGIIAVIIFGWFLVRLKSDIMNVLLKKSMAKEIGLQPGKVHVIGKIISALIVILVILLMMEVTGVSVNTLIAFGGISGLGIAFASQEIIANFFGGIMIHVVEPFAIGDYVVLQSSSVEGKVEEIGWYETRLSSPDKQPIYIPNSLFSKAYVMNGTRRTHRRIIEKISIRHEDYTKAPSIIADIKKYLTKLEEIDTTTQRLLVNIHLIGPYSIDINVSALSYYTDEGQFLALRDTVLLQIIEIISSHGAEVAIPVEAFISLEKGKQ